MKNRKLSTFCYKIFIWIINHIAFRNVILLIFRKTKVIPSKLYCDLKFKGVFKIKIFNNRIKLNSTGYETIENQFFWEGINGYHEKESLLLWGRLCEFSNVIIDIGANNGIYSLVARSINSQAKIFAFEPIDFIYKQLLDNLSLNNFQIDSVNCAVSNHDGVAELFISDKDHSCYTASLSSNDNLKCDTKISVKSRTLKSFINQNDIEKIDIIKIDVEMHEPFVIEGMGDLLMLYKPTMIIEILTDDIGQRIEELVSGCNYLFYVIDEVNGPIRVNSLKRIQTPSYLFNFLICTSEIANKLCI